MQQRSRQLTDPCDGFLLGKCYLLYDRGAIFTQAFDGLPKSRRAETIIEPPRSPKLTAHCERFIRSIQEASPDRMHMLGERLLSYVTEQYLVHYHTERHH